MKYCYGREEEFEVEDVIETVEVGTWHIGEPVSEKTAKQFRCRGCGGILFEVGTEDYWTGVRCPTCKYEIEVHEG